MIDAQGFRSNVGIVVANARGEVLWARRIGQDAWQFPQGGIQRDESPEDALYRELHEELGLAPSSVEVLGATRGWLRYRLPRRFMRKSGTPVCVGQKQRWFLLRLRSGEDAIRLDVHEKPEFDAWRWVDYWHPVREVIFFKRGVYRQALGELAPLIGAPPRPPGSARRRPGGGSGAGEGGDRALESGSGAPEPSGARPSRSG